MGSLARATGVVTAEAGRIGTPALLAIGDATAGLVVKLPSGSDAYGRGTVLEVTGKLAAPYGQLEIRPAAADIRATGSGTLPAALPVPSAGLDEESEGRLLTATGRLLSKPKKSSGGDVTITLERDGAAPVKVMADVSSGVTTASFTVGTTYRVVGVAGQRASRSGALDGYRIWIRDGADLVVVSGPPAAPGASASPGHGGSTGGPG